MDSVDYAFKELYPEKELDREIRIRYSGKFKPYNANVRYSSSFIEFNLSREWKEVSKEIRIGLIQSLLVRIFKGKPNTGYRDLYESFIKNLSRYTVATKSDPVLEGSFQRVNEEYFDSMMDIPNLEWGSASTTKLGHYCYQTNTISISSIFRNSSDYLLDYIMYHEMLHKKLQFRSSSATGRSLHHSAEFRKAEKQFRQIKEAEAELKLICRKAKFKKSFFSLFSVFLIG